MSYTIDTDTLAPFQIGIYSSPDGTTPDQLLTSYMVGGVNSNELSRPASHTVSIAPPAADVSGDYYLIAQDDQPAANTQSSTAGFSGAATAPSMSSAPDAADTVSA